MPSKKSNDLFTPKMHEGAPHIHVGTGSWTYAPWRDNFFPKGLVQRRELEYASRHLTAIEINGTYYGAQKPATYARWRGETPEGFVFSLKAPRYTTDRKELASAGDAIYSFISGGLAELGDRLGPILWQFPLLKRFEARDFEAFLDLLPASLDGRRLRHVLEVRDPGFMCAEYLEITRRKGFPTVYTDSPDYPSFADLSGDFSYARLMCSRPEIASGYASRALDAWAVRARIWSEGGDPPDLPHLLPYMPSSSPRDVFIYFINGAKERAPHAAMALIERLARRD